MYNYSAEYDYEDAIERLEKSRQDMADANFIRDKKEIEFRRCLESVLSTEEGIRLMAFLFSDLGMWRDVWASGAAINKYAALHDFARQLEGNIDQIDLNILPKIKADSLNLIKQLSNECDEHKNQLAKKENRHD